MTDMEVSVLSGPSFYQYMKLFVGKGSPITEQSVIPTPHFGRAVDYRVDVVKEFVSLRSVVSPRRRWQAACTYGAFLDS